MKQLSHLFGIGGPVADAVKAQLKEKIASAEEQFVTQQEALLKEFEEKEAALLKGIVTNLVGEKING